MLFNTLGFLVFFPLVFTLYWLLPGRFRPYLLLAASCYFYMAFVPQYILILFFLITIDFFLGKEIAKNTSHKHFLFILSIISNVGVLFVFKYFNFFNENVALLAHALHWNYSLDALSLILPLGLSFHIFQSLGYIIEVYKGKYPAERNYLTYALYVMFFPQLVAGPIERPAHLLPQLHATQKFDYERVLSGFRLMLWGFFKKVVIANRLAVLVEYIYSHMAQMDASVVLIAVIAFSIQLYADFSGYSDIAVGSARMLGIDLTQNFGEGGTYRSPRGSAIMCTIRSFGSRKNGAPGGYTFVSSLPLCSPACGTVPGGPSLLWDSCSAPILSLVSSPSRGVKRSRVPSALTASRGYITSSNH
jgi:D-alanyl-lipoteichoic acid acyltransferase DltB (MBOAT superfamily)